ncbi:MAG TPA: hypothetical protein PLB78_04590, partial [Anaerolineae bacterium]|nr:hypothetical protein [Anaerolineae bacterium]
VEGLERVPERGNMAFVFNHYYSRSFASWWSPISITALVQGRRSLAPGGISWIMAGAWTYPDALRQRIITPLTQWAFRRLAHVYGLVVMPPMPPRPHEVEARAGAVRHMLALARRECPPLLGLSPEGHDGPKANLIEPPSGVGRFLLLLGTSLAFVPVGVYEEGDRLVVRFGEPFALQSPEGLAPGDRDAWASTEVMLAIGRLLPPRLWGAYRSRLAGR